MTTHEAAIQTLNFSNDEIMEKVRELKRDYNRQWRARNRKKATLIVDNYWTRKAVKELAKKHM